MTVDLDKLKGHISDNILGQLPEVIDKFGIDSVLRLSHFISQCSHESGNFTRTKENMNYSVDGLLKTFGKYFNSTNVESYARQPEKIGSKVYANRLGNGDEASKEGYKYSGKGYIQLTGKNNYKAFGDVIKVDLIKNPDLVATDYPLLSAAWFFQVNNILPICDLGSTIEVITKVTKRINGGTINLDKRIEEFNKFYNILK